MKEKSIWHDNVITNNFPSLNSNIKTDVLVIGGGIAGILVAYELKKRNIKCVLVEKNKIGCNISKNTTAFITAQHEFLYQDIIKKHGIKKAEQYLNLNLKAIDKYQELALKYDFNFKRCPSILFSSISEEKIINEQKALEKLNFKAKLIDEIPFFKIKKGIMFENQATIHPLKLINELAKELNIYENTEIIKLKRKKAYTNKSIIKFDKVIITTHYPIINKLGLYFIKIFQRRSYVVSFKHNKIDGTFCSIDENGMYFRSYEDYLIIGGNDRDHKETCKDNFTNKIKSLFNNDIEYEWSNQDCITLDNIPYIGHHNIFHNNWYVATGFNMWGFTWAMVSSFVIADLIENKNKYQLVNPMRICINKQLFLNLKNTMKNLITLKKPRCKHMGCALKFNEIEKVYECPCHGSRYDENGKLLDGPARKNLN